MSDRADDKEAVARSAGLRLWSDSEEALHRRRCGSGFAIVSGSGTKVSDSVRQRVDDLVIPPAWTEVRICPDPDGHLQATGRDADGRKQYLYHPEWQSAVRRHKFSDLAEFGDSLGSLREQVDSDLRRRLPELDRTAALSVALIDRTGIRVGSPEYTRDNDTYGLTTLLKQHASVRTTFANLRYQGKSHQERELRINGRRWVRHLRRLKATPGERLMRYQSSVGWSDLDGSHVNDYLRRFASGSPSAKRFRTWIGSVAAFLEVHRQQQAGQTPKRCQQAAVRRAASVLGNTVAVCREHYIHPAVLEAPLDERGGPDSVSESPTRCELLDAEPQLIALLRTR